MWLLWLLEMSGHQIQKIFPGLLNICARFEEIPSTSKDAIGKQTCGAGRYGGPFHKNSSHMQTSVHCGTLNYLSISITSLTVFSWILKTRTGHIWFHNTQLRNKSQKYIFSNWNTCRRYNWSKGDIHYSFTRSTIRKSFINNKYFITLINYGKLCIDESFFCTNFSYSVLIHIDIYVKLNVLW